MIFLSDLLYHTGQETSLINFCPKTITPARVNTILSETDRVPGTTSTSKLGQGNFVHLLKLSSGGCVFFMSFV